MDCLHPFMQRKLSLSSQLSNELPQIWGDQHANLIKVHFVENPELWKAIFFKPSVRQNIVLLSLVAFL